MSKALLIIILLIAIIAGCMVFVAPIADPSADGSGDEWQTCMSETEGYRIDYPPGWEIFAEHLRTDCDDCYPRHEYRRDACDSMWLIMIPEELVTTPLHPERKPMQYHELDLVTPRVALHIAEIRGDEGEHIEEKVEMLPALQIPEQPTIHRVNYSGSNGAVFVWSSKAQTDLILSILRSIKAI